MEEQGRGHRGTLTPREPRSVGIRAPLVSEDYEGFPPLVEGRTCLETIGFEDL